jgi:hypothetical protein
MAYDPHRSYCLAISPNARKLQRHLFDARQHREDPSIVVDEQVLHAHPSCPVPTEA